VGAGIWAARRERSPALERLVVAVGPPGQVHDLVGRAYADAARRRWAVATEVLATAGGVENLRLVAEGRADIGFAAVDVVENATQGDAPFTSALPIVALARLYDDYVQIVVPAGSPIRTVRDLRGRRVATGAADSGTDIVSNRILAAAGISADVTRRRLSAADAVAALRAGTVDAFVVSGGLPTPLVVDLAADVAIRVLPMAQEVADLEDQHGEYYLARSIPPGVYGLRDEVTTLGIPTVIAVRRSMPDDVAYRLTELLFAERPHLVAAHEEARRLDPRSARATYPADLHPGAARYYRTAKPMAGRHPDVVRPAWLGPAALRVLSRRGRSRPRRLRGRTRLSDVRAHPDRG
jgi:TRAP transporter TAXI family solute receptor